MIRPALILGTEPRVAISVARSLAKHGLTVDVAALRAGERPLRSRWIRSTLVLGEQASQSSNLAHQLTNAVEREGYDHLVATSDSGLRLLADCYRRLSPAVRGCIPPPEVVAIVLDKRATLSAAMEAGLPVPAIWQIPDASALGDGAAGLRFPMVAKPADKRLGESFKVRYFRDLPELRASFDADATFGRNLLFQEFVPGEGVGVEILMHHGEPVCAFQHRRLRELPWAGGVSVVAESESVDPALLAQSARLLRALGADGLSMVEYRRDRASGASVFMEVNARAYGSLSLSELCGVQFPWYHWQLLHEQRPAPPARYRVGLRWRWSAGILLRLDALDRPGPPCEPRPSVVGELLGVLHDLLPPTRDALWSWSDPVPALAEAWHAASRVATGRLKAAIHQLLPPSIAARMRALRDHPSPVRSWMRQRRIARRLGRWVPAQRLAGASVGTVLFVCHGNILRSPMCEYLLRRDLDHTRDHPCHVLSAGLHAKEGNAVHPHGVAAAAQLGIDLTVHRARPVTDNLVYNADLVIVMDFINEAELLARFPAAASKTVLLGDLARGERGVAPVPDPYGSDLEAVRQCYIDLQQRIAELRAWLARPRADVA